MICTRHHTDRNKLRQLLNRALFRRHRAAVKLLIRATQPRDIDDNGAELYELHLAAESLGYGRQATNELVRVINQLYRSACNAELRRREVAA